MSYILFSQTSTANGTRNSWSGAGAGHSTGLINPAVVGGLLTNAANSMFSESAISAGWGTDQASAFNTTAGYGDGVLLKTGSRALYDLSDMGPGAGYQFNAALTAAFAATGNVMNAGAAFTTDGSANNRTLDAASGYSSKTLNIGLADANWNDIKNVEVFLASSETGAAIDTLTLRSFVDARVKIGDTDGCRNAAEALNPGTFRLEILDGKRGQVEGAQSDMKLDVTIDVWTNNSGWQNSFSNTGSVFDDRFDINFGSLAVVQGISEFGLGAGALVDANDTSFGTDTDQTSAYNGQLTTLLTNMGAGNDLYDARTGVAVVTAGTGTATVAAELRTIDYVWGGSGNDTIYGGGNSDFLYGDFGTNGGIGQMSDPAALSLKLGGSGDVSLWVNGTGATIYGRAIDAAGTGVSVTQRMVTESNLAERDFFEVPQSASAQDAATWNGFSAGLGISGTRTGNAPAGDQSNPEVNFESGDTGTDSDVLGVNLGRDAIAARFDLSLFYSRDGGSGHIETALITVGQDTDGDGDLDVVLGSFTLRADGTTTGMTGSVTGASGTVIVGGAYASNNPGLVSGSFSSSTAFDVIEFRSAGLVNSSYAPTDAVDVSDFFLREICYTVPGQEGNDLIDGGSGNDRIEGGGDTGALALCGAKGVEKLLNGSFETVATGAELREGGTWYLTAGAPGAGVGFGWTATGGLIEIQKDGTGGLSPFDGSYKLELDSHHQADANPLVQQVFSTCDGAIYTASFAFAERQGEGDGSSDFQLFWDGDLVATFTNPTGTDSWTWSDANATDGVTVAIADAGPMGGWWGATVTGLKGDGNDSLGFKGLAAQTNTFGTFIDTVSVKSVYDNYATVGGDTLSGGTGNDVFVYNQGDGVDVILDFAAGDKIDLDVVGNYTRSTVIFDGVLSTLIDSNLDTGAILVRGVASMVNTDFI